MSFLKKLLERNEKKSLSFEKNENLPSAVAFVDYEHWYISCQNNFSCTPDIKGWFQSLNEICNIKEVIFFANFSKFRNKEEEVKKIRSFTNKIIDTFNPDKVHEKDYTDFIILDNIYQKAIQDRNDDLFVIFTGDGHFNSVVAFLKNFCKKEVVIYGVKGCINQNLRDSATAVYEIPDKNSEQNKCSYAIFDNLYSLRNTKILATFKRTVPQVSQRYGIDEEIVRNTMVSLIDKKYIRQSVRKLRDKDKTSKDIRVIEADWKKIKNDKMWDFPKEQKKRKSQIKSI